MKKKIALENDKRIFAEGGRVVLEKSENKFVRFSENIDKIWFEIVENRFRTKSRLQKIKNLKNRFFWIFLKKNLLDW